MKLITLLALLVCACGKGGDKKSAGNPAMVKEAEDLAKRFCECPDRKCADEVKTADGKETYPYFMKSDESSLTEAERKQWGDARSKWNDCAKPGYFKKK